jgi:YidC/Oxa1 family membrane protein insertase
MDKKNTTIGVLLLVAAFGALYFGSKLTPTPQPAPNVGPTATPTPLAPNQAPTPAQSALPATQPDNATFAALATERRDATVTTLANDFIEVRLTNYGGAIRDVALRKFEAVKDQPAPVVFNELHADPMLAFTDFPNLGRDRAFDLVSATSTEVVYRTVFENRIEVTRRYRLDPAKDPYVVRHETTFRNLTGETAPLPRTGLSLGTAAPVNTADYGQYLNVGYHDGDSFHFTERAELQGGGFLSWIGMADGAPKPFIEQAGMVQWATVKNQFFAAIATFDQPGVGIVTRRVELPPFTGSTQPNIGVSGTARVDLKPLIPEGTETLGLDLYVGPKEYRRLSQFDKEQDRVMQFDRYFFNRIFFSNFFAKTLLSIMTWVNDYIGSFGWSIVVMTLILKTVFLPLTLAASKSSKRMAKIQPEMQELREKFKDNPQKLNQATIDLFKKHKVNPMGGCLPILVTIPFFIGFFAMLQSASELRFAEFLWAPDLSAPDTIARIFGLPINIMPLLMGATMVLQMRLVPTPTVDNAQAKIFKFMPYFFTLVCYNFSCALALYSTVGNVFTIGQQLIINRMKDDDDTPAKPAATPAKLVGKKKK